MERRKHPRLRGYDYGLDGAYFITICTDKKRCVLSRIVGRGLAPAAVHLLPAGEIVAEELENLKLRFPTMSIDQAVIMPNHIHLLLRISAGASPRPTGEGGVCLSAGASPRPTEKGDASPRPTEDVDSVSVVDMVRVLKSITTRRWNIQRETVGQRLWQSSFYDHIIRDEADYLTKWNYIFTNPARWAEDKYYI